VSIQPNDERGAPRHYDDPLVANAPGSDGSDVGAVEDGQVRIVRAGGIFRNPSVFFTTLPARRHFLESADSPVPSQWGTFGPPLLGTGGIEELLDLAPPSLIRFYRIRAEVLRTVLVYTNDFEGLVGSEWNVPASIATTPIGARKFLGEFAGATAALQLSDLPPHTHLKVSFDLFVLKSWDGNHTDFGPDQFYVTLRGGSRLFSGTFSNYSPTEQSYPGAPGSRYPSRTGAVENNTLGYTHSNLGPADAVYHLTLAFEHTAATVTLDFSGVNLQDIPDESWGLDNVRVEAIQSPPPL
jgi:hypothetical protein